MARLSFPKRRSFKCRLGRSLKFSLAREERIYKGNSESVRYKANGRGRRDGGASAESKGKTCTATGVSVPRAKAQAGCGTADNLAAGASAQKQRCSKLRCSGIALE